MFQFVRFQRKSRQVQSFNATTGRLKGGMAVHLCPGLLRGHRWRGWLSSARNRVGYQSAGETGGFDKVPEGVQQPA